MVQTLTVGRAEPPGVLSRAKTHSQTLTWHFALATLLCDIR
jgi:hypothetical protein